MVNVLLRFGLRGLMVKVPLTFPAPSKFIKPTSAPPFWPDESIWYALATKPYVPLGAVLWPMAARNSNVNVMTPPDSSLGNDRLQCFMNPLEISILSGISICQGTLSQLANV